MGRIQEEFGEQGLEVVAINIVPDFGLERWRAFWKSIGAGDVVWAQDTDDNQAVRSYNVQSLGTTIIIGRDGKIVYRDAGATTYEKLREEVLKALDQG